MNIKRRCANIIFSTIGPFQFSSTGIVGITFHNIEEYHKEWFEKTINKINNKYQFINPLEIGHSFKSKCEKIKVCLTVDDGFNSSKNIIGEILSKYRIKAIFFVPLGFIGLNMKEANEYAGKYLFPNTKTKKVNKCESLSWEELNWLKEEGHTIGGHTRNHPILKDFDKLNNLYDEIVSSADEIEKRLCCEIDKFAFPFGKSNLINDASMKIAIKRFKYIFSNVRGSFNESPGKHFIFRQNIIPGDNFGLVRTAIEGKQNWKYKKERRVAHLRFGKNLNI